MADLVRRGNVAGRTFAAGSARLAAMAILEHTHTGPVGKHLLLFKPIFGLRILYLVIVAGE